MWIGISGGVQEKIMWNFQGSWFLVLELLRDVRNLSGISRGKVNKQKIPGTFVIYRYLMSDSKLR